MQVRSTTEVEPQLTLRSLSTAITRLIHAPSKQPLYSVSLDSSIRVWALPSPTHTFARPSCESALPNSFKLPCHQYTFCFNTIAAPLRLALHLD
ncbi:hypothetical protein PLICRDRAFT_376848 [Plicaturopsis crispa FD-325 SS-3]|nr:hypothetical protein PLICRDRAFT_376848 [Plicaturopsis crispa FD-325 SS-3]